MSSCAGHCGVPPSAVSGSEHVGSRTSGGWKTEWMMRRYEAVTDQTLRAAAVAVSGPGIAEETAFPACNYRLLTRYRDSGTIRRARYYTG